MGTVAIFSVPYFLAREREGMGAGPDAILQGGLVARLAEIGWQGTTREIRLARPGVRDIDAVVELNCTLAAAVREALAAGQFPLVLGGNCHTSLGALAGIGQPRIATMWLDAHGDFNTPATSPSGFIDGMCLAIAAGRCHPDLMERIGVPEIWGDRLVHAGGRDFDLQERQALLTVGAAVIPPEELQSRRLEETLLPEFARIAKDSDGLYVHVDLDVLDPRRCPANEFQPDGGLLINELLSAIRVGASLLTVRGAAITAYNPDHDKRRLTVDAAARIAQTICANVR